MYTLSESQTGYLGLGRIALASVRFSVWVWVWVWVWVRDYGPAGHAPVSLALPLAHGTRYFLPAPGFRSLVSLSVCVYVCM